MFFSFIVVCLGELGVEIALLPCAAWIFGHPRTVKSGGDFPLFGGLGMSRWGIFAVSWLRVGQDV